MNATEQIKMQEAIRENHEWHQAHDDHNGYKGSELEAKNLAALAATEQPEAQEDISIEEYKRILDGLSQDAIDGGWTAKGICAYAKSLEEQIAALKQEQARMKLNAERYLHLRSKPVDSIKADRGLFIGIVPDNMVVNGEDADKAIDAEIVAQKGQP